MTIKERFTVFETWSDMERAHVYSIYDNLQRAFITKAEAEAICMQEYGEQYNLKQEIVNKVIDGIIEKMEEYNYNCDKGFEITIDDIISHYKTRNKS